MNLDEPAQLMRREFLCRSAKFTVGIVCLGALGGLVGCGDGSDPSGGNSTGSDGGAAAGDAPSYGRQILVDSFEKQLPYYRGALDPASADKVIADARADFEGLIPQVPYVGDPRYPLPETLIESAVALSFYRSLMRNGQAGEEAGAVIAAAAEASIRAVPADQLLALGEQQFTEGWYQMQRMAAAQSQQKPYPGDWVYSFVEGVPGEFDWGWDFTECGILKLYKTQGAEELVPYLCAQDFTASELENTGLRRTGTLARGDACCDFRYLKGREPQGV